MFKYVYLLALCFCLCAANDLSETGRKKGGFLLYGTGMLYYLTFILVKIKIIAVVGTLITLALVAGKIYAFYKYISYVESHKDVEPIYQEIPHHHDFPFGKEVYLDHPPYESDHDHSEHIVDSPPQPDTHDKTYSTYSTNSQYQSGTYPTNNDYPTAYSSPYSSNYHARKIDNNISNALDITKRIFRRLKLSELAFDAMHIKSADCKRRFMCEAFLYAENNQILSLGLTILNDTSQEEYRPEKEVSTLEECRLMYKECDEEMQS